MKEDLETFMDPDEVEGLADVCEVALCEKLDPLIGGNTLLAALDLTLSAKLLPHMLDEEMLDLLSGTVFVDDVLLDSGDKAAITASFIESLWGVAQYFRFCDLPITETWVEDMMGVHIPIEIQNLPEFAFTTWVLDHARAKSMTDEEAFAVIRYLCIGDIAGDMQ